MNKKLKVILITLLIALLISIVLYAVLIYVTLTDTTLESADAVFIISSGTAMLILDVICCMLIINRLRETF